MNRKVARLVILGLLLGAVTGSAQELKTGQLTVEWGDPEPGVEAPPVLQLQLTTEDGVTRQLLIFDEVLAKAGGLLAVQNRRVTVELLETQPGERHLLPPGTDRVVAAIRRAPEHADAGDEPVTRAGAVPASGANPWVSLPCRFSDIAAMPRDQVYFQDQFGDNPGELNHFWKTESYNLINIDGSIAEDWLDLPGTRASYVPTENACLNPALQNADLGQLFIDCVAAHDTAVDFAPFVGINLLFNGDLDGCAWGGTRFATLDGVAKSWPVTWEPPFGYTSNRVFEHENGHGYGLPHSTNWDNDGYPYDNKWDYMSDGGFNPGGANPYGTWGTGGMAWHKELLGWLTPAEIYVAMPGVQTIDLDPLGAPTATNQRMIKIPLGAGHWWTVEAREKTGTYESGIPDTAVLISEVQETGRQEPLWVYDDKVPPASSNGNEESMWKVGETFSDAPNGITIEVLQTIPSGGFRVRVTTPPGSCTQDSFESDDSSGEARVITSAVTKNHSICPVGNDDWSTFTLTEDTAVTLETSGPGPDDTVMMLRDSSLIVVTSDDDSGTGLFSKIERVCGVLPVGTYFVEVEDFSNNDEIQSYDLDLTLTACPCVADLTLSTQTLTGAVTYQAAMTATLGPALTVDGTQIRVRAGQIVSFLNDTEIGGTFTVGNTPVCAP